MAHDKTPAATDAILFYTVLTIVTLGLLYPVFNAYFDHVMEGEVYRKQLSYEDPDRAANDERQSEALEGAAMPIDRAMGQLAERGRRGVPLVTPRASDDVGAVEGWGLTKNTEGAAAAQEAHARVHAPPPPPPVVEDAGVVGEDGAGQ